MSFLSRLKEDVMDIAHSASDPVHVQVAAILHRLISYVESNAGAIGASVANSVGGPVAPVLAPVVSAVVDVAAKTVDKYADPALPDHMKDGL